MRSKQAPTATLRTRVLVYWQHYAVELHTARLCGKIERHNVHLYKSAEPKSNEMRTLHFRRSSHPLHDFLLGLGRAHVFANFGVQKGDAREHEHVVGGRILGQNEFALHHHIVDLAQFR